MTQRVEVEVRGDAKSLHSELGRAESRLGKFGSIGSAIGKGAALGIAGAGLAVGGFVASSLKDLARVERVNAQTAATIKSTGGAAGVSTQQVADLAGKLERYTGTEAEATQEGQNLLLTFTNIKNEAGAGNKIFDRTTTAMVDLSRAMGTEPKAAAIQLGKALNDPIKGVGALSRVGVSFTEQQKNTIKSLVETGDTMGAQKIILAELEKQFGGSGRAFAQTTEGKIEVAKHAIGDLGEKVSAGLLPLVGKAATGVTKLLDKGTSAYPQIAAKVRAGLKGVGPVIQGVASFMGRLFDAGQQVAPVVARFAGILGEKLAPVGRQLAETFTTQVLPTIRRMTPTILQIAAGVGKFIGALVLVAATIIGKVLPPVIRFAGFLFGKLFPVIVRIQAGVVRFVGGLISFGKAIIDGVEKVNRFNAAVREKLGGVLEFFRGLPGRVVRAVGDLGKTLYTAGKAIIQGLINGVTEKLRDLRSKLNEVTNLIPDWKGPRDRDARLLTPAGRLIIGGLVKGVEQETPAVRTVLERLTRDIETYGRRPARRATPARPVMVRRPIEQVRQAAAAATRPKRRKARPKLRQRATTPTGEDYSYDEYGDSSGFGGALEIKVKLTAEQKSAIDRGREVTLDLKAYKRAGGKLVNP